MYHDKNLQFLADKIVELNNAIFYSHSNSPLKIHNTVIQTYQVDSNGCISFFIQRPQQLISQFDREFPVGLNYFRKGKDFYINIFGKARIINDPEELAYENHLSAEEINNALTTHAFIKVNILKAEVHERGLERKNPLVKSMVNAFAVLFESFRSSRSYDFSPGTSMHNYGF